MEGTIIKRGKHEMLKSVVGRENNRKARKKIEEITENNRKP